MNVPARSVAGVAPTISIRNYAIVTAAYWAFTLTDGALRMLVLLHFNQLGYTPVQLAFLFLLYEFFGIVTNLVGGWIASRARLALFAARDVWFVVSVPIFLASVLEWSFTQVGGFMALWVIAYGGVQSVSPIVLAKVTGGYAPGPALASTLGLGLAVITALIPIGLQLEFH